MGQVIALNVETINFCLTHLVEVSALRMLSVCHALVMMTFICLGIIGCFVVDSVWLFNLSDRVVPYSAESSVKSVVVVLSLLYEDY